MTSPLWHQTAEQLLRAERLLQHSVNSLDQAALGRRRERDRIALELEQLLNPLADLSQGLTRLIEEMAGGRQDNRLQRWQGQLQQLLSPLDLGRQMLEELVIQLDQPLDHLPDQPSRDSRDHQKRQQLQQLVALRQKQVMQMQAEVRSLQQQLFAATSQERPAVDAPQGPEGDAISTPSIFS